MPKPISELKFINFPDIALEQQIQSLWKVTKNTHVDNGEKLIFYHLDDDSQNSRMRLRGFLSSYRNSERESNRQNNAHEHARIIIALDQRTLFFGWDEDIVCCYDLGDGDNGSMKRLVNRLIYYPFDKIAPVEKFKIKSKGYFNLEEVQDICFCLADGNYTEIHMSNGSKRVESKAIGFIEKRLGNVASIQKVGRSLLINRNRVLKVDGEKVWFSANADCARRVHTFGQTYINRIRRFVYWY